MSTEYAGKAQKPAQQHGWTNILSKCKAVLRLNPRPLRDGREPRVLLHAADTHFLENFACSPRELGDAFPLSNFYGEATNAEARSKIEQAMLTEQTVSLFINLYSKEGYPLSCHVTVRSLSKRRWLTQTVPFYIGTSASEANRYSKLDCAECDQSSETSGSESSAHTSTERDDESSNGSGLSFAATKQTRLPRGDVGLFTKWAVITVRSASVIGNSKYCGISLMGVVRVNPSIISEAIGKTDAPRKKRKLEMTT